MTKFAYMSSLLYKLFKLSKLANIYENFWNPINYAVVGGFGVLINYIVFVLLISALPWWITNAIAILIAWIWNWSMSVGPLGWVWGFKDRR